VVVVVIEQSDHDNDNDNDNDQDSVPGISVNTSVLIAPGHLHCRRGLASARRVAGHTKILRWRAVNC
ncbi:hypothetical protein, partial [uncultured Thiodictyon sp.]|uniref:hypothetical protein n=1 Tax=uncultured Thiodictyon sp. TaxID=1846217 RepID=UPI0025CCD5EF